MQQKDVIYIDVEDDITAIIGKVKAAKLKIVALVPPKRIGVLQSAVNLRLLARAADSADKRLVLITGNSALAGLAASAKIPVAKNLQSRPEIAEIPTLEADDDDVIDGEQLPVGEHAGMAAAAEGDKVPASTISNLDIDGDTAPVKPKRAAGAAGAGAAAAKKKGIKVPDFGSFRKRAALFGIGGVLLVLFLIWANVIAPHATVTISAKTTEQTVNIPVTLGADLTTSADKATIKTVSKTEKSSQSVDFDATGKKNIGNKATGTVQFSKNTPGNATIPAGTSLTSSTGLSFTADSSITVPGATVDFTPPYLHAGSTTGSVTAAEGGTKYNGASGSLDGTPDGVSASFSSATSGGTDKNAIVVLQADVEGAKQQLADQNADDMKDKLKAKFGNDMVVIDSSFTATGGDKVVSSPDIGQEAASGKAKLTRDMTYTMTAIPKSELNTYLDAALKKTLTSNSSQRVYDNGISTVKIDDFKVSDKDKNTASGSLGATGQIGPMINDVQIKDTVKGKRYGEIQADLKAIDGVSNVSVNLSPFWVQTVPNDPSKISIEFKLIKTND
jgi:hypothetical protein